MSRIITPNGSPDPRVSMADLIKKARDGWDTGKKNEAFQAAMTGLELCSKGIARLMIDMEKVLKKLEDKNDNQP